LLGGDIGLESRLNHGSKFILRFKSLTRNSVEIQSEKLISVDFKKLANKTVLIAEDEESNFVLLEEILRDKYMKSIWIQDGGKAVEICKKRPEIDLIIMDIKMPVMDGYEAAKKIKSLIPELPIIALSAFGIDKEEKLKMEKYFSEFLLKPVENDKLLFTIQKLLF